MKIRIATINDLPEIKRIIRHAKTVMQNDGNFSQWEDIDYPECLLPNDIKNNNLYVLEDNGIHACFAFIIGEDSTYLDIRGKWLNDNPYGTIHRLASDGAIKEVFHKVIEYCKSFNIDIRIDTHIDNKRMIHLINKEGFIRTGIIKVLDGTDREAFQLAVN